MALTSGESETPITPCIIGDEVLTQEFSKRLNEEGVYAKSIVFPTVPKGTGRVRNMPTAAHTKEMLDEAIRKYEKSRERNGHHLSKDIFLNSLQMRSGENEKNSSNRFFRANWF